jgi:hypothetical protein
MIVVDESVSIEELKKVYAFLKVDENNISKFVLIAE